MITDSDFGKSVLAAIFAKFVIRIVLIDCPSHPRFTIGESSTSTVAFILKAIVKNYELTDLEPLTKYGFWKWQLSEMGYKIKKGFSFLIRLKLLFES